jgi:hypothetical protein
MTDAGQRPRWQNKNGYEKKKKADAPLEPGWSKAIFDQRQDVNVRVDDNGLPVLDATGRVSMRYGSNEKIYTTTPAKITMAGGIGSSGAGPFSSSSLSAVGAREPPSSSSSSASLPSAPSEWARILGRHPPATHHVCFVSVVTATVRPACAIGVDARFMCGLDETKSLARSIGPVAPGVATQDAAVDLVSKLVSDYVKMGALMDVDEKKSSKRAKIDAAPAALGRASAAFTIPTKLVMIVLDDKGVYQSLQSSLRVSSYELLLFWCVSTGKERALHMAKRELLPIQQQSGKKRARDS